ncbi:MAG TPA: ERCC4 domain-containing protein [Planctomycetota bacterium]|nr:ERCC4 domain-containing protein [Planctomycetota bacterium]
MNVDMSVLTVSATKPKGKPAKRLAEMGIRIAPIEEDEGDVDRYVLSKRLAIERRTGAGFLKGIMDKTLFTSAIYLREHFQIPVLIVEGELNYQYSMFDPQAIRGALSSMMILYGLNVLSTPDVEETAALIAMMARQEQIGIPEISLIPKRKAADLADQQRRIVEMLPGCGMVMARDLLQHFGSVRRVLEATEGELRTLRGIGAKKAREMVKVLNADYEAVDTERNLEDAIAAAPELLLAQPVALLARQHYIFSDAERRHFVDLVFLAQDANELILVELKRGRLAPDHYRQLRQYMDLAHRSSPLRGFLDKGARLRGVLATVEHGDFEPDDPDVCACIVDRQEAIEVLKELRRLRLESEETRER